MRGLLGYICCFLLLFNPFLIRFIYSLGVNGNLALSRAIGDFDYKQNDGLMPEDQIVTVDPEITVRMPNPQDEFFIVACDGKRKF